MAEEEEDVLLALEDDAEALGVLDAVDLEGHNAVLELYAAISCGVEDDVPLVVVFEARDELQIALLLVLVVVAQVAQLGCPARSRR